MYKLTHLYPEKRAFITGAGSGLGRAMSIELASEGWTIGISDINQAGLDETEILIKNEGGNSFSDVFDVANHEKYEEVSNDFLNKTGGIDLLINNAGVGDGCVFGEYSLENWHWIVGINQMGVVYGCHYFVPVMKKQKSGQVINIASAAAFCNMPNMSPYNITKAAVLSLSESLYTELRKHNVWVSVVMPTFINTNIMQYSRGGKKETDTGKHLVGSSSIQPKTIAEEILKRTGNRKFYILLPSQAKVVFFIKRMVPGFFLRLNAKVFDADKLLRTVYGKKK